MRWYRHVFTASTYWVEKLQVLEWVHQKCCLSVRAISSSGILWPETLVGFKTVHCQLDLPIYTGCTWQYLNSASLFSRNWDTWYVITLHVIPPTCEIISNHIFFSLPVLLPSTWVQQEVHIFPRYAPLLMKECTAKMIIISWGWEKTVLCFHL